MDSVKRFTQAYSQAPWRKQLQLIFFFLVILLFVALIAGVYLNVTALAVKMGSDIQVMQANIETLERQNADLDATLAYLNSDSVMQNRAQDMGFKPVNPNKILYLKVNTYPGRQEAVLAPPPGPSVVQAPALSPVYTESLVDWFKDNILKPSGILSEVQ